MFVVVIHFRTWFIFTGSYILVSMEILIVFFIETLERESSKSVIIDKILDWISRFNLKIFQD